MKRKITLIVEELEERIAPHAYLGMGESEVMTWKHGEGDPNTHLRLPNGKEIDLPAEAYNGLDVASG